MIAPGRPRPHFGWWALLYALVVFYASTFVSVTGIVIFPRDPEQMFLKLMAVPLVAHGSDQRADWMGNLGMLIPLGFLATAYLLPAPRPAGRTWGVQGPLYGGIVRRVFAVIGAMILCVPFILGVKYVQLFTPRTVILNYIIAQTAGAAIGSLLCVCAIDVITVQLRQMRDGSHAGLVSALRLYTVAVFVFALAPFDAVVSAQDVADRMLSLPNSLFAIPGADRSMHLRLLILAGGAGMMVPVGMWLQARTPAISFAGAILRGLALVVLMLVLSMAILSASPSLFSVPLRLGGILAGIVAYRLLARFPLLPARRALGWLAALALLPYLAALLAANSVAAFAWRNPAEVWATLDPRYLLPFWTHYMVPKAQAIKSVVVHVIMYMPIGAMVWAWCGGGRWQAWLAAILGFALALAMEVARAMTPGLMLDLNNVTLAAVAAGAAVGLARMLWAMAASIYAMREQNAPSRDG